MMKEVIGVTLLIIGLVSVVLGVANTACPVGPVSTMDWETTMRQPVDTTDQRFVLVGVGGMVSLILGIVMIMHILVTESELDIEREKREAPEVPIHDNINTLPSCQEEIFRPDPRRNEDRGIPEIHRLLDSTDITAQKPVPDLYNPWISEEQRNPREISGIPLPGIRDKNHHPRNIWKYPNQGICD